VLSLYIGQQPYSIDSILDVSTITYGQSELRRQRGSEDGKWLTERVAEIRKDGGAVLATSRIAAHLVGNRDLETVGQFMERRDQLSRLSDTHPLHRYEWLVLDRREQFQQTPQATSSLQQMASQLGFIQRHDRYDIVIFQRAQR
jgi:hypothetical protein